MTTIAASRCGTNARVARVLPAKTEPSPGGVDEAPPRFEQPRLREDLDGLDVLRVLGLALLGDEVRERVDGNRLPRAAHPHSCRWLRAVAHHGNDGGDRGDADKERARAQQRIQQRGLPALELADARHVEPAFSQSLGEREELAGDGFGLEGACDGEDLG